MGVWEAVAQIGASIFAGSVHKDYSGKFYEMQMKMMQNQQQMNAYFSEKQNKQMLIFGGVALLILLVFRK